mgnify:CR=1 FL=1
MGIYLNRFLLNFYMFIDKGKRGKVYKIFNFALKIERKDIKTINRIKNEAGWLKILNKHGIGPKLYFSYGNWILMKFVNGERILDYFKKISYIRKKEIIKEILLQCYEMDKLKVNKFEMNHPDKHIVIDKKVVMIDFEKCKYSLKPKNVTQFLQFLNKLGIQISKKVIEVSKKYKENQNDENFKRILELFN